MIILLHIEYRTHWGEEIKITGDIPELGNSDLTKAVSLRTTDGINWSLKKQISLPESRKITYTYHVFSDNGYIRHEWNMQPRVVYLHDDDHKTYRMKDCWKDLPEQLPFYSSAFTDALLARKERDKIPIPCRQGLRIKIFVPDIASGHVVAIAGNQSALGNWEPGKALRMSDKDFPEWQAELNAKEIAFPLEYKFVILDKESGELIAWEECSNHELEDPGLEADETCTVTNGFIQFRKAAWKGCGTAIPVFSLRSAQSFGIGDFGDLKLMIDWSIRTKQQVIQILPINDTTITHTWTDSYPYNGISIYALHPVYMNLNKLGSIKNEKKRGWFEEKQHTLNMLPAIDYEAVERTKWEYIREMFKQEGEQVLVSDKFRLFFEENKEWLKPYAAYSYLRDIYGSPNFREWPQYSIYIASEIEQLCLPGNDYFPQIAIYYYIQYNLHCQLLEASEYARANGVVLKGDIPIGISSNSVEAWVEPFYFNMEGQAGAPPDDFSVNGQNWGFPTYNWDIMEQDNYSWWMKRFKKMSEYFDAYRIDHILGFFRIWEIPLNAVHGLLGQFVPALPMTREEIENYGLHFREEFLTPYIHEYFLPQMFDTHTQYIKETFLETTDVWEIYRMREEFNTQRKVEAYFADKTDSENTRIRDGLYALISNVLFVRDHKDPEKFHPRISAQLDLAYHSLRQSGKDAFNRLYNHFYYHRHNDFWYHQAMRKLPQLIQSTRMLVCGEDLGMIPDCVATAMNNLRILSLEVQRMPKDPNVEFGNLSQYPYRSVCTFSTHDMSTLRGWWEEEHDRTQRYFNRMLHHDGEAPQTASPEICKEIILAQLKSNSMLCILAFQDWIAIDDTISIVPPQEERINIPANPKHYWRYRMHITLEELIKATQLNEQISTLITSSKTD